MARTRKTGLLVAGCLVALLTRHGRAERVDDGHASTGAPSPTVSGLQATQADPAVDVATPTATPSSPPPPPPPARDAAIPDIRGYKEQLLRRLVGGGGDHEGSASGGTSPGAGATPPQAGAAPPGGNGAGVGGPGASFTSAGSGNGATGISGHSPGGGLNGGAHAHPASGAQQHQHASSSSSSSSSAGGGGAAGGNGMGGVGGGSGAVDAGGGSGGLFEYEQPVVGHGHEGGKASDGAYVEVDPDAGLVETDDDDGAMARHPRKNFASAATGAVVMAANPEMSNVGSLLSGDADSYALSRCDVKKYVVVALSEDVLVDELVLSNEEKYSSSVHHFRVTGSVKWPTSEWLVLGNFTAANKLGEQAFPITAPGGRTNFVRYLRVSWLSHFGAEFYCTWTRLVVHGSTMLEDLQHNMASSEAEVALVKQQIVSAAASAGGGGGGAAPQPPVVPLPTLVGGGGGAPSSSPEAPQPAGSPLSSSIQQVATAVPTVVTAPTAGSAVGGAPASSTMAPTLATSEGGRSSSHAPADTLPSPTAAAGLDKSGDVPSPSASLSPQTAGTTQSAAALASSSPTAASASLSQSLQSSSASHTDSSSRDGSTDEQKKPADGGFSLRGGINAGRHDVEDGSASIPPLESTVNAGNQPKNVNSSSTGVDTTVSSQSQPGHDRQRMSSSSNRSVAFPLWSDKGIVKLYGDGSMHLVAASAADAASSSPLPAATSPSSSPLSVIVALGVNVTHLREISAVLETQLDGLSEKLAKGTHVTGADSAKVVHNFQGNSSNYSAVSVEGLEGNAQVNSSVSSSVPLLLMERRQFNTTSLDGSLPVVSMNVPHFAGNSSRNESDHAPSTLDTSVSPSPPSPLPAASLSSLATAVTVTASVKPSKASATNDAPVRQTTDATDKGAFGAQAPMSSVSVTPSANATFVGTVLASNHVGAGNGSGGVGLNGAGGGSLNLSPAPLSSSSLESEDVILAATSLGEHDARHLAEELGTGPPSSSVSSPSLPAAASSSVLSTPGSSSGVVLPPPPPTGSGGSSSSGGGGGGVASTQSFGSGAASVFKMLTRKLKDLEIDQSVVNSYLSDLAGKYTAAIAGLHGSLDGTKEEIDALKRNLSAVTAAQTGVIESLARSTLELREVLVLLHSQHVGLVERLREQARVVDARHEEVMAHLRGTPPDNHGRGQAGDDDTAALDGMLALGDESAGEDRINQLLSGRVEGQGDEDGSSSPAGDDVLRGLPGDDRSGGDADASAITRAVNTSHYDEAPGESHITAEGTVDHGEHSEELVPEEEGESEPRSEDEGDHEPEHKEEDGEGQDDDGIFRLPPLKSLLSFAEAECLVVEEVRQAIIATDDTERAMYHFTAEARAALIPLAQLTGEASGEGTGQGEPQMPRGAPSDEASTLELGSPPFPSSSSFQHRASLAVQHWMSQFGGAGNRPAVEAARYSGKLLSFQGRRGRAAASEEEAEEEQEQDDEEEAEEVADGAYDIEGQDGREELGEDTAVDEEQPAELTAKHTSIDGNTGSAASLPPVCGCVSASLDSASAGSYAEPLHTAANGSAVTSPSGVATAGSSPVDSEVAASHSRVLDELRSALAQLQAQQGDTVSALQARHEASLSALQSQQDALAHTLHTSLAACGACMAILGVLVASLLCRSCKLAQATGAHFSQARTADPASAPEPVQPFVPSHSSRRDGAMLPQASGAGVWPAIHTEALARGRRSGSSTAR